MSESRWERNCSISSAKAQILTDNTIIIYKNTNKNDYKSLKQYAYLKKKKT